MTKNDDWQNLISTPGKLGSHAFNKGSALIPLQLVHPFIRFFMEPLFLCFSRNNMLVGNNCREHHFPTCCKLSPSIRSLYRTMFVRTSSHGCLNWIDCNTCDSQLLHRRLRGAEIEALTKWARIALRLFHRSVVKARLLLLRIRSLSDFEVSLIVDFAAWRSDKRVQARPASSLYFLFPSSVTS